jgi:hypothetical protein
MSDDALSDDASSHGAGAFPVELLRCAPDLLEVVAQLVWVAAPGRRLASAAVDEAGLVPLRADAPLAPREHAAFDRGLDALLREEGSRARGVYLREVCDARGRRLELGVPVAPAAWRGTATLVGPFDDEVAAQRWSAERVAPPLVADTLEHGGCVYVDVFPGDADGGVRGGQPGGPQGGPQG